MKEKSKSGKSVPQLFSVVDLAIRWGVSKQLASNFVRRDYFPAPVMHVANGRTALYLASDVYEFEQTPEFVVWVKRNGRKHA